MASHNDSQCRLAFLGERDERHFLEPLSTQLAVSNYKFFSVEFFSVRQLEEYKDFGCDYCVLYSPTYSIESIMPLVDSAGQCPTNPKLILLLLKHDTTYLENELRRAGKSVQIILLKDTKVPPAVELISSYLIVEGRVSPPGTDWGFVGASEPVQKLYPVVQRFACWDKDPVLILGLTGTGKELVAKYLHRLRHEDDLHFHALNLAALPLELTESLLFGHEKGAFTGAVTDAKGLIVEAGKGTLFLDEIGETHPAIQAKLLRVLQERKVSRLGREAHTRDVHAGFVFATNRKLQELKEACRQGRFREDFLQRIDVLQIRVPTLKERKEDIPLLVKHFVEEFKRDYLDGGEAEGVGKGGAANRLLEKAKDGKADDLFEKVRHIKIDNLFKLDLLFDYEWPGNVRELRSVVRRSIALTQSGAIDKHLAELLAEKQKDRERNQTNPEAGATREHAPRCDERTHGLGSFVESLLKIDLKTAQDRFKELYEQDLFLQTGGEDRLMKRYSKMARTWRNDLNARMKRSEFHGGDLREADRLATMFMEGTDPVSTYVRSKFDRQVSDVANHRNGSHKPAELAEALVDLLNDLRKDPKFYQPELFRQVQLSDEARGLLKENGLRTDLITLNRILIEDAYPEVIVRDESIRTEVRKRLSPG
jgi:DNA-binding NtrC family response regulator